MSQPTGTDGRPTDGRPGASRTGDGRFGAATPGLRGGGAGITDLVTASPSGGRRRAITPWRVTALIAALLAAGGSYALGRYVIAPKPPHLVQIAVTAVAVPAGTKLTASDVRVVTVRAAAVPPGFLSPAAAAGDLGLVTRQVLPSGTFLASSMLSRGGGMPGPDQALVGLDLKAGQLPADGLVVGQRVLVVLLPVSAQGVALAPEALISTTVWEIQPPGSSGDVQASVVVPASKATELTSYAARGEVSLVATAAPPPSAPSAKPTPPPRPSHKPGQAKATHNH